jgi:IMP dehydrogenase
MSKFEHAQIGLTFDDVVLVPQYSEIQSRKDPNVATKVGSINLDIPIFASPMNTVVESQMMIALSKAGGSSVLHRYMPLESQLSQISAALVGDKIKNFFVAIGATGDYLERAKRIYDTFGIRNFCVDVANGHSKFCIDAIRSLVKEKFIVMAGNVCEYSGAYRLADVGADSIRVGIGNGSMCITRQVTGHGIPQLTALEDCCRVKEIFPNLGIIADGGMKTSGDGVKALAIGADALMLGSLFAGTDESPGDVINLLNRGTSKKYKKYAGMASEEGRELGGWFDRTKTAFVPEGESTQIPYKGPVKDVIEKFVGGIRVGMSYSGAASLRDLKCNARWMRVTSAGYYEGTAHGVRK